MLIKIRSISKGLAAIALCATILGASAASDGAVQIAQATVSSPTRQPPAQMLKATSLTPAGYLLAYTGMLYGEAGGFMKNAGLDLTVQASQGSAQAMQQLLTGQALVTRGAGLDVMNAVANSGVPVIAIGTIAHIAPLVIISSADHPIRKASDMVGKTIGIVSVGGATSVTLDLILAEGKVDSKTVTRQVVGPGAGSFGLIQEKKIDAFIGTNAAVVELKSKGVPFAYVATHDLVPVPGQVYITAVENLTKHPEELARFLRGARAAFDDAYAQVQKNDISKLLTAVKKYNVPEAANPVSALEGLRIESLSWVEQGAPNLLRNNPAAWTAATKLATDAGMIKASVPTRFYTNEIWDKAFGK
jgi:NitT/TauT family transport system substrate-binding protein